MRRPGAGASHGFQSGVGTVGPKMSLDCSMIYEHFTEYIGDGICNQGNTVHIILRILNTDSGKDTETSGKCVAGPEG